MDIKGALGKIAQRQDFAPDLRRGPHVHAPCGLRDNQQFGFGINLAAHDELLQIAT